MASSMECQLCTPLPNPTVRTTQNTHTPFHTHAHIYFQVASFGGKVELYFFMVGGGGSKITADGKCNREIKRYLLLGRKVMTNLDSILKSRNFTLPTKVHLVKALVFPVVMY